MIGTEARVRAAGELVQRMNQRDRQRLLGGWRRISGGCADGECEADQRGRDSSVHGTFLKCSFVFAGQRGPGEV